MPTPWSSYFVTTKRVLRIQAGSLRTGCQGGIQTSVRRTPHKTNNCDNAGVVNARPSSHHVRIIVKHVEGLLSSNQIPVSSLTAIDAFLKWTIIAPGLVSALFGLSYYLVVKDIDSKLCFSHHIPTFRSLSVLCCDRHVTSGMSSLVSDVSPVDTEKLTERA